MATLARASEEEGFALPDWVKEMAPDGEMFARMVEGQLAYDWAGRAPPERITVPTLILVGEQELVGREAEAAAAAMPDCRAVYFAGLGHVGVCLGAPEESVARALPFLRRGLRARLHSKPAAVLLALQGGPGTPAPDQRLRLTSRGRGSGWPWSRRVDHGLWWNRSQRVAPMAREPRTSVPGSLGIARSGPGSGRAVRPWAREGSEGSPAPGAGRARRHRARRRSQRSRPCRRRRPCHRRSASPGSARELSGAGRI